MNRFIAHALFTLLPILAAVPSPTTVEAQAPPDAAPAARLDSLVEAEMERRPVPGASVAVIRGADTLLFRGYGHADLEHRVPATPGTIYRIASLTKQFTAAAVLHLADAGRLSLDDPLERWVPEFSTGGQRVLLKHLLNHTSGIPNYYGFPGWQEIRPRRMGHDEARSAMRDLVADEPFDFEPGAGHRYSNTGYDLLGDVVERASGMTYEEYVRSRITGPLGLENVTACPREKIVRGRARGYDHRDGDHEGGELVNAFRISPSILFSSGGLCSTVGDLVAWSRALHEERRILSDDAYHRMVTPEGAAAAHGYAYGLGVGDHGGHPYLRHNGAVPGFSAQLDYYPEDRLHVVVLMNGPAAVAGLAEEIGRAVLGLPTRAVANRPAGWKTRTLVAGADTSKTHFRRMGAGLHVTAGPAAVYAHPDSVGLGAYAVEATLIRFRRPDVPAGDGVNGLVLGARPGGDGPTGLHFLVGADGRFRVVRVDREGIRKLAPWTSHPALEAANGPGRVSTVLRVEVGPERIRFLANGTEVASLSRSRTGTVEGPVGVRIGQGEDVHVGGFRVGAR